MPKEEGEEMNQLSKYNIVAKYKDEGYAVLCKCPRCEVNYIMKMQCKPIVKPRIYCEACEFVRYDSNEGSGSVKTKKAGRKAAA